MNRQKAHDKSDAWQPPSQDEIAADDGKGKYDTDQTLRDQRDPDKQIMRCQPREIIRAADLARRRHTGSQSGRQWERDDNVETCSA